MKIKTSQVLTSDKRVELSQYKFLYLQEKFYEFLKNCFRCKKPEKQEIVKKAFQYLQKQKSDIKLITHSLEVAQVIGIDIGLGATSVVSALLHELPDKTDFKIEDIRIDFGAEVADIIEGFYKIKNTERYFKPDDSENADLYKSIVLNMAKDLRIISLRIADRLVTLRHFDEIALPNKAIIPEETLKVYAPIADVLGSYRVKMELEELAFKYYKPEIYQEITSQLKSSYRENTMIMNRVALPLIKELFDEEMEFKILSRQKSIYSIYRKLINKKLSSIDEIYDILAFRIILFSDHESCRRP
jgi:GTP pyrophosphokinase